ncbi:MAG: hypothetical protein KIS29_01545 [Thermoplasmata archaeon]|nr:hypothetical protein [Candidatus Sysuiplasma jiujiangense]
MSVGHETIFIFSHLGREMTVALYMKLNTDIDSQVWENGRNNYGLKLIGSFYKLLKERLSMRFGYKETGISVWRYAPSKFQGGETMEVGDKDVEAILRKIPDAILKIDGKISFIEEEIPVSAVLSLERDFVSIYENISLNCSLDSNYEDLCDVLDRLGEKEYGDIAHFLYEMFSDVDSLLAGDMRSEGIPNLKHAISYCYLSRVPVEKDLTEYYFYYSPRRMTPERELLDFAMHTASKNREEEPQLDPILESRENTVFRDKQIVSFLSDIDEVRTAVQSMMRKSEASADTSHSTLLVFSRNQVKRRNLYRQIKDNILLKFLNELPERDALTTAAKKIATNQQDIISS